MTEAEDRKTISRLTLEHRHGQEVRRNGDALLGLYGALTWHAGGRLKLPGPDEVTAEDTLAGLRLIRLEHQDLDHTERMVIEAAKDRGVTWETLGKQAGKSGQAMQQRYKRLGGTKSWPTPPPRRTAAVIKPADADSADTARVRGG